ncbi:Rec8 like protein-domain-containing protein [Paraphoma chrysanthemicola]|nr:Rec8 like protein-domain-containing protein [Paraphoma chrysanthemicola]
MFYSHEVLTSRKYGVATVWLVATLGSKSNLKRINRKQILDVDVSKACQTIVDPVAPMALRLQGNLLYGVSRVYLQQCGYVLSDAQSAHNAMRMMLRTVQNLALDPEAGKARPEQLVLPDDPSFLPDFALPPPELVADLDLGLNFDIARSGESQSLTPFGSQQSPASSHAGALGGLVLPSSSPNAPGFFQLAGDDDPLVHAGFIDDYDFSQLGEPEFTFDENGELIDGPAVRAPAGMPAAQGGATMHSDAGASEKVRRDHEEGQFGAAQLPSDHTDIDLPLLGDDLPEGQAFPNAALQQSSDPVEVVQSSSTASAPMRKKRRAARVLPTDATLELKNKDLADWNSNYLQNMEAISKSKKQGRIAQQAKKDAEYVLWGSGLGGIAQQFAGLPGPNPFDMFMGDNLFELYTGASRNKVAGAKHDRDSGIDDATQKESRRVRQKTGEPEGELGRGMDDEGFFMPGDDEVELPREAPSALDDDQIFSAMPWNMSASRHGSSAIPGSRRLGMLDHGKPTSKPGSRMVSASPLHGRGLPLPLEPLLNLESDGDDGFGGNDFTAAGPGPSSPPTVIDTAIQPSTRVREALSAEGENFLSFVTEAILEKRTHAQADAGHRLDAKHEQDILEENDITFEALLPPAENTKMIACQGLMMVLALGTKGMLDVKQDEGLGDINLKLSAKTKASQVVEISDGEESEEENASDDDVEMNEEQAAGQQGGDGEDAHFNEQFAAGIAAGEQSDHDSLYDG